MLNAGAGRLGGLLEGAARESTGCLYVHDPQRRRSGRIYFDGPPGDVGVVSVQVKGFAPRVARRLLTGGLLAKDEYDAITAALDGNLYHPRSGDECVRRGLVAADVLVAVHRELVLSALGAMCGWPGVTARFRGGRRTDRFVVPPIPAATLMAAVGKREERWHDLWRGLAPDVAVHSCVPVRMPLAVSLDVSTLTAEARAVLDVLDGHRTVDEVAGECGLSRFEAGHVLQPMVRARLVRLMSIAGHAEQASEPTAVQPVAEPPGTVSDTVPSRPVPTAVPLAPVAARRVVSPTVPTAPANGNRIRRSGHVPPVPAWNAVPAADAAAAQVTAGEPPVAQATVPAQSVPTTRQAPTSSADERALAHLETVVLAMAEEEQDAALQTLQRAITDFQQAVERVQGVRRSVTELRQGTVTRRGS